MIVNIINLKRDPKDKRKFSYEDSYGNTVSVDMLKDGKADFIISGKKVEILSIDEFAYLISGGDIDSLVALKKQNKKMIDSYAKGGKTNKFSYIAIQTPDNMYAYFFKDEKQAVKLANSGELEDELGDSDFVFGETIYTDEHTIVSGNKLYNEGFLVYVTGDVPFEEGFEIEDISKKDAIKKVYELKEDDERAIGAYYSKINTKDSDSSDWYVDIRGNDFSNSKDDFEFEIGSDYEDDMISYNDGRDVTLMAIGGKLTKSQITGKEKGKLLDVLYKSKFDAEQAGNKADVTLIEKLISKSIKGADISDSVEFKTIFAEGGNYFGYFNETPDTNLNFQPSYDYAKGGKVGIDSKVLRKAIKEHILDSVYDENENQFDNFNDASEYLISDFKRVADVPYNKKKTPNVFERFRDYLKGIPFNFEYKNDKIEEFLKDLGYYSKDKNYFPIDIWRDYSWFIWREISDKYYNDSISDSLTEFKDEDDDIFIVNKIDDKTYDIAVNSNYIYWEQQEEGEYDDDGDYPDEKSDFEIIDEWINDYWFKGSKDNKVISIDESSYDKEIEGYDIYRIVLKNKLKKYAKGGKTQGVGFNTYETLSPNKLQDLGYRHAEDSVRKIPQSIFSQEFFMEYVSAYAKQFYDYAQISKDFSENNYAKGGDLKAKHILHIDGQNWFLEKIDNTHFYMSNDKDFRGMAHHIGQHRGEPYYEEVRQWLKDTYAKGGEVELKEISTPQLYSILKLKFTKSIQTNTDYKVGNDVYYIRDGFGSKRLDDDKLYLYKKTRGGNELIGVLTTTYAPTE